MTLIGPDERASAGVARLQGKPLLPVGVHHALHVFGREAAELGQLQEGTQGHEAICGQAGRSGVELFWPGPEFTAGATGNQNGAWAWGGGGSQRFIRESLPFLGLHFLNLQGNRICLREGHKDKVPLF